MEIQKGINIGKRFPLRRQVKDLYQAFREFIHLEASGGILLLIAAGIALLWANSPWADSYFGLWNTPLSIGIGGFLLSHDFHWWINDGLMVIFFLVVGLEIKREILVGELSSLRQAVLPIAAAVGGMLFPALIYRFFNLSGAGASGWGIPMATDIAFALGVMTLVGSQLPIGLKIFLTALAIVDDIGAILVIALFYSGQIQWLALAAAGVILLLLLAANLAGIRSLVVYSLLGIALWFAILNSGIHATIAGVLVALLIPAKRKIQSQTFLDRAGMEISKFIYAGQDDPRHLTSRQQEAIDGLQQAGKETQTPLQRLEHALHPWAIYAIIPIFALANAGVTIGKESFAILTGPVSLGVVAGLLLGKPVGISLATWISVKLRLANLPEQVTWRQIHATSLLAGIGFTMSLFISELAFSEEASLQAAKIGILAASLAAGLVGFWRLRATVSPGTERASQE